MSRLLYFLEVGGGAELQAIGTEGAQQFQLVGRFGMDGKFRTGGGATHQPVYPYKFARLQPMPRPDQAGGRLLGGG